LTDASFGAFLALECTPGGNNYNDFPDNQLANFCVFIWLIPDFNLPLS